MLKARSTATRYRSVKTKDILAAAIAGEAWPQIAVKYGMTRGAVISRAHKAAKRLGIKLPERHRGGQKGRKRRPDVTLDEVIRMRTTGETPTIISRRLNVSRTTITNREKEAGNYAPKFKSGLVKVLVSQRAQEIRTLYVDRKMSLGAIASRMEMSVQTIQRALSKLKIPRRPRTWRSREIWAERKRKLAKLEGLEAQVNTVERNRSSSKQGPSKPGRKNGYVSPDTRARILLTAFLRGQVEEIEISLQLYPRCRTRQEARVAAKNGVFKPHADLIEQEVHRLSSLPLATQALEAENARRQIQRTSVT
jgi:hypothetical protein